ncbi:MAG: hypothetical protein KC547_16915 [Anaerolineae bacterium]|nr:hypothetical protein [Anaerolineae bacterium]
MTKVSSLKIQYVDTMPQQLDAGILYVSKKYKTAMHLCCCGCGNKVATPLKPGGWQLSVTNGLPTLHPSVGNFSFPCQSHYIISSGNVQWARQWTDAEIAAGRARDQAVREAHYDRAADPWWVRVWNWIKKLLGV